MAEVKKPRSIAAVERELAAMKAHMKTSGVTPPAVVDGTFKYSGKEEAFKDKEVNFRIGTTRVRFAGTAGISFTSKERAELFDRNGLLIAEKAIKNAKIMNHLIERKSALVEDVPVESEESTEEEGTKEA